MAATTTNVVNVANGADKRAPPFRRLDSDNVKSLADSVDAFLFDCDGVIWKGDELIDGVADAIGALRAMIYVVGEEGILQELELAGYKGLGGPEDGKKTVQLKSDSYFEHDRNVGAVIVGLDPNINYYKLQYATLCIRENPGCLFIATNCDAVGHMTDLQEWPGAGTMVAAIRGSTQREPVVVGKPSRFLMDFLLERFQVPTSRMCMIGDRLDTDIMFGRDSGCTTLLVLSGVTSLSDLKDPSNTVHPDYYTNKVADVVDLINS